MPRPPTSDAWRPVVLHAACGPPAAGPTSPPLDMPDLLDLLDLLDRHNQHQ